MTRDADDTLAAIADVITWYGSRDAMRWTAEPAKADQDDRPPPDPEELQRLFQQHVQGLVSGLTAAMEVFHAQVVPVIKQLAHGLQAWCQSPAMQELMEFVWSAEGRALIEAHERGELFEPYRPCHCFCGHRHGDQMGICDGEAEGTLRYESRTLGAVDVPMCRPCITVGGQGAGVSDRPNLPTVSDLEEAFRRVGAEFGKAPGQMQRIFAAQGAMGWAYRGNLDQLRAALEVLPAEQVREISAAAALLGAAADDVLREGGGSG